MRPGAHLAMAGGPFGACLVRGDEVLAVAHNTVLKDQDPTSHGETNAIRLAARKLQSFDLSGCEIYSTTEPCPMCFAAIHWARIGRLIYGTAIIEVARLGFNELTLGSQQMQELAGARWPCTRAFSPTNAGNSSPSGPGYRGVKSTEGRGRLEPGRRQTAIFP